MNVKYSSLSTNTIEREENTVESAKKIEQNVEWNEENEKLYANTYYLNGNRIREKKIFVCIENC